MPSHIRERITALWKQNGFRSRRLLAFVGGLFSAYVVLNFYMLTRLPIPDVSRFQRMVALRFKREFSQNGEDGIIEAIFRIIGTTNKYYVEFGAEEGLQCNTRYLMKRHGWRGLLLDGDPPAGSGVYKEFITAENIQHIFSKHNVPHDIDLLSIDIDGNDYWVWNAITDYHPRVVIIEYNSMISPTERKTIPYKADFLWDRTDYYGASLGALESLGRKKGYRLIGTDKNGVNAFFVKEELARGKFKARSLEEMYHSPRYRGIAGKRHPPDLKGRPWIFVTE